MTPDEAKSAVAFDGTRVIARYADGSVCAEGEVYSYSVVPVLYILTDEGERVSWRHDMCEPAPTAAEEIVARFDSYSDEQHAEGIWAARRRARERRDARLVRARAATERLRQTLEDVRASRASEAQALRDAALALERRSGEFKLLPGDRVRRQTHADIARWLRSRADGIEGG